MPPISSTPVTIPDRDLAQDKSLDPLGPRICCPLCGWSPRKEDKWFCTCGNVVQPMVAAFGLVRTVVIIMFGRRKE